MDNSSLNILVYGFYQNQNLGDDFFQDAFYKIFPQLNFKFVNKLTKEDLLKYDNIFFGGGSFVYSCINMEDNVFDILKTKNIFYIGIGIEKTIHNQHIELMKIAKLIATRSEEEFDNLIKLNENVLIIPDIVYSLKEDIEISNNNKILFIPNVSVVPNNKSEHWQHTSWNYFKSEISQALDELNYKIDFMAMSDAHKLNDNLAAAEIINLTICKPNILNKPKNFKETVELLSKYKMIITQRFHGIVLSEILNKNYISIYHHDKLKNSKPHNGESISYYGFNKNLFLSKINSLKESNYKPINSNIFKELNKQILNLLGV